MPHTPAGPVGGMHAMISASNTDLATDAQEWRRAGEYV